MPPRATHINGLAPTKAPALRASLIAGTASAILLLSGCASTKAVEEKDTRDPALETLERLAMSIETDLQRMAAVDQQARGVDDVQVMRTPPHSPLAQNITLRWSGPVEAVVKAVADMVGYEFLVTGQEDVRQRIVHIDANDEPAFQVLQNIGRQAGRRVSLVVDDDQYTISVAYRSRYDEGQEAPGERSQGGR